MTGEDKECNACMYFDVWSLNILQDESLPHASNVWFFFLSVFLKKWIVALLH